MDHPNVDPSVNKNITEQEKRGGIDLTKLALGTKIEVRTRASSYFIEAMGNDYFTVRGGKNFPTATVVGINGSTWGGTMLKMGWLGIGMNIEFANNVLTSSVQSLKVIAPDGSWNYDI